MPDRLDQRTRASTKNIDVANEGITTEPLLYLQRQPSHAAAHVSVPRGQPDPHARGNRDHARTTVITRRSAVRPTPSSTRTHVPSGSTISIRPGDEGGDCRREAASCPAPGAAAARFSTQGAAIAGGAITRTGMNSGTIGAAASSPRRTCLRHWNNCPRLTSCRRATAANTAPGASASATIQSLSSSRQRRRRSTPVMISIRPVHNDAHMNVVMDALPQQRQAAQTGWIRFYSRKTGSKPPQDVRFTFPPHAA